VQGLESCPRPAQRDAVSNKIVSPEFGKALEAALKSAATKSADLPAGLSVAVLVPGRGYWTAQFGVDGHGSMVSESTRFHAASAGKLITAALVAEAVAEGRLNLSARLDTYLEDMPEAWRTISLGTLLNHSSGLGTFDENPAYDRWAVCTTDQLINLTPSELLFPSGTAHCYSNTGYVLLGLALEKSAGRSWEAQLQTKFFDSVAGCHALTVSECGAADIAIGHIAGEPIPFLADYVNTFSCGGIVGSALDLGRLYDSILNQRALSAAATNLLYQNQIKVQDSVISVWAGRGINRVDTPRDTYLLHRGSIPGFSTLAGSSQRTGITVVVMANDTSVVTDDYFFGLSLAASDFIAKSTVPVVAIESQPSSVTVKTGDKAWFSLTARNAQNYQWQRQSIDGSTWADLVEDSVYHNTRTAFLHVHALHSMDGEHYRCVVSNDAGSVTSHSVALHVFSDHRKGGGAFSPIGFFLFGLVGAVRWFRSLRK
jgi:D-alanyl-D-alanine carboxypeptidase